MNSRPFFAVVSSVVLGVIVLRPTPAFGFEADVHYGLTRWLALRAGFTPSQADAIAIGDQRVDAGLVEATQLNLEYACAGHFPATARLAQLAHFPADQAVPAPTAQRTVLPGGPAARRELAQVVAAAKGKEGLMLGRFGRALHPLQDSWSHQGVPSTPDPSATLACDASLASAPPSARGGPDSHAADLTSRWPADTLAMAHATYDQLSAWGPIEKQARQPAPWTALATAVDTFAKAASKSAKRAWFVAQGMSDTRFLAGISLPDGPDPGVLDWPGRMIPPLPGIASQQHDAPADVRGFFDGFLARWLSAEPVEKVVADLASHAGSQPDARRTATQLAARLKLWKLHDHGAASELAHARAPFTPEQLRTVDRMTRDRAANLQPATVADAVLPLQPSTPAPVPMLPYILRPLPPVDGAPRTIAIARLKHAPYDTVGWIAEQRDGRWALVEMVCSVDP